MRKIDRRKNRIIGLIGYPLSHSLSPIFQQAALDYYDLPVKYEAWEVTADRLDEVVDRLKSEECLGANVTIPHKEAIIPKLDKVVDLAAKIGAVNTVVKRRERLHGYNTDSIGFLRALDEDACYDPDGKRAAILGAGGAARAVAVALLSAGAATVFIFNRDLARATILASDLRDSGFEAEINVKPLERQSLQLTLPEIDVLINTTPIGMKNGSLPEGCPIPEDLVPDRALVFDLVYNPPVTRLLAIANRKGAQTINGLSMLVYQGAAAFEMWTGEKAPLGLMFERVRLALNGDG